MLRKLTRFAAKGTPFLFFSDFKGKNLHCYTLDELKSEDIEFTLHGSGEPHNIKLIPEPISFAQYASKIHEVQEFIRRGETYLLNLTQPTPVRTSYDLKTIYRAANAPFKLRYKDQFVCFSPEKFIEIEGDTITTYPMKGTIDAAIPDAKAKILADSKEMAEHLMVVDLLRNDLGIVGRDVKVEQFRYVHPIQAGTRNLLQVSSKISARLPDTWQSNLPRLLQELLPAGSISGTPKKHTVELIQQIERYERGYFTGVFGYFDGSRLTSAVMIRYLEKSENGLIYKSGGGITIDSNARSEYEEMLKKIYVP